jgi:hypothetical protein
MNFHSHSFMEENNLDSLYFLMALTIHLNGFGLEYEVVLWVMKKV